LSDNETKLAKHWDSKLDEVREAGTLEGNGRPSSTDIGHQEMQTATAVYAVSDSVLGEIQSYIEINTGNLVARQSD
jgi:hypothetical protein